MVATETQRHRESALCLCASAALREKAFYCSPDPRDSRNPYRIRLADFRPGCLIHSTHRKDRNVEHLGRFSQSRKPQWLKIRRLREWFENRAKHNVIRPIALCAFGFVHRMYGFADREIGDAKSFSEVERFLCILLGRQVDSIGCFFQRNFHMGIEDEELSGLPCQLGPVLDKGTVRFRSEILFTPLDEVGSGAKEELEIVEGIKIGKTMPIGDAVKERRLELTLF